MDRKKPRLDEIFSLNDVPRFSEKLDLYMKSKMYDEAYAITKRRYNLGGELRDLQYQLDYYSVVMMSDRPKKSIKIRDHFLSLMQDKIQTNPHELRQFGIKLLKKAKYFEAILFFDLSAALSEKRLSPNAATNEIQCCAHGMMEAIEVLLKVEPRVLTVIQHHVMETMYQMRDKIHKMEAVTEKIRCMNEAWCLHHVVYSQCLAKLSGREDLLREGIDLMRQCFGDKAEEKRIFGYLLNNLGAAFESDSRYSEAIVYYKQAIKAKKKGRDYKSDNERVQLIRFSERNLSRVEEKLACVRLGSIVLPYNSPPICRDVSI